MDTSAIVAVCFVHLLFGGLVGVLLSNIFSSILVMKLRSQLDKAIDDMFDKDLELDQLEEKVGLLNDEVKELKAKFPTVEASEEDTGYVSESSTELDNTD